MKKLGEILLDQGLITPDQLENVLRRQSMSGGRFGEHLVQMLLLDEIQVHRMLALQKGVPAVSPGDLDEIPEEVIEKVPGDLAESFRIVPFRLMGRRLHIAMLDPEDIQVVDNLSHRTGYIIRPYVCMESVLNRALSKHYQITPKNISDASVEASLMQDLIVHEDKFSSDGVIYDSAPGLVSVDGSGQFTMYDRSDLVGDQTKKLFLEAETNREALGYFLQLFEQVTDRLVFLAVDGTKNYFWREVSEFRRGAKGKALYDKLYKSPFWKHYLADPDLKYFSINSDEKEMSWVPKMLKMESTKAFVLAPIRISTRLLGVAMGGSATAMQLRDEMDVIQKLQLITECSLTILRCKRTIQEVE